MADELRLDIIVDDHGAAQKLEGVDKGVEKIKTTADATKPSLDELGKRFGVNTVAAKDFQGSLGASELGLARFSGLVTTVGVSALTGYAYLLGQAAREADKLSNAADGLDMSAARLKQLSVAAGEGDVSFERLTDVLDRFRQQLATGKLDIHLQSIGVELAAFKQLDADEQFLQLTDAIGSMRDPLEQVDARVKILGPDTADMARLMTTGFREATDGARAMKDDTIQMLNEMVDHFKKKWQEAKDLAVNGAGDSFAAFMNLMGRGAWRQAGADRTGASNPDVQGPPKDILGLTDGVPTRDMNKDASMMRHLELLKQEEEEWYRIDEIMRQIAAAQDLITKKGGDWSDVLDKRVAVAVDNINAKYVNAVMLNSQLGGNAAASRDAILKQLQDTTNPNDSAYDKRFNEIDQQFKTKMAAVDQTDRVSAAHAENLLIEEMNAKLLELGQSWEMASTKVDDHKKRLSDLQLSYQQGFGAPGGGVGLPGGLQAPTGEQLATGRYFGPVTPNGQPDLARMGGATPVSSVTNHIDARGSVFDSEEAFVARMDRLLAERERDRGARTGR